MVEIRFVLIDLLNDYATVRQALVNYITCNEQSSNFEDRCKAEKYNSQTNKFMGFRFIAFGMCFIRFLEFF